MSRNIYIAIVLLVVVAGWLLRMKTAQGAGGYGAVPPEKAMKTYLGLRKMALTATSARAGLKNIGPDDPVSVLMDVNLGEHMATIVAYADGATSIYVSNGGVHIGGGQSYPSVREAGQKLLAVAHRFQPRMQKTQNYPLPKKGVVFFYVVTDGGVYTASAPEAELNRRTHPLTELFAASEEIMTQYRLNSKKP